jgi:hypothetical protein
MIAGTSVGRLVCVLLPQAVLSSFRCVGSSPLSPQACLLGRQWDPTSHFAFSVSDSLCEAEQADSLSQHLAFVTTRENYRPMGSA